MSSMKKQYKAPIFEKITFNYKAQMQVGSPTPPPVCIGSVINIATSESECGEGTPSYFGWTKEHPGPF